MAGFGDRKTPTELIMREVPIVVVHAGPAGVIVTIQRRWCNFRIVDGVIIAIICELCQVRSLMCGEITVITDTGMIEADVPPAMSAFTRPFC